MLVLGFGLGGVIQGLSAMSPVLKEYPVTWHGLLAVLIGGLTCLVLIGLFLVTRKWKAKSRTSHTEEGQALLHT